MRSYNPKHALIRAVKALPGWARIAAPVTALALLGGGGAVAAMSAGATSTPSCSLVWSTNCQTPVVAQSASGVGDLIPANDQAMTYLGANPAHGVAYGDLGINFNNDLQDGTQDFAWSLVGHVPHIGGGPGSYGFTGFDRFNFGGSGLYEVRYVPNGIDTGLCLTVSSKYRSNGLVLGSCISDQRQVFIVTQTAPALSPLSYYGPGKDTSSFWYAFEVAHSVADAQQHNALLDPHPGTDNALAAVGTPLNVAPGSPSLAMWASIG